MDGAIWYAIYNNGEKIIENNSLYKKGLLALNTKRIKEFGLESDTWRAYFSTNGSFFFNGAKVESALPDREIKKFKLICHNKVVLESLVRDASQQKYLVFGYKTVDGESVLLVSLEFPAYLFLRKRKVQNTWIYAKNSRFISKQEYNLLFHF